MGRGTTTQEGTAAVRAATRVNASFATQRKEVQRLLAYDPQLSQVDVPLVSLIGSQAYGLATETSDADYRGVYVADPAEVLGLKDVTPHFDRRDPDVTIFELGKFCRLAYSANPNILEVLWAPTMHADEVGQRLRRSRHLFVSQLVRDTYAGFAASQLKKIRQIEANHPDKQERRAKYARHLFRLFEQGQHLLEAGELEMRVSDPDQLRQLSVAPIAEIEEHFAELDAKLKEAESSLPLRADLEKVNKLVQEIRFKQLGIDPQLNTAGEEV